MVSQGQRLQSDEETVLFLMHLGGKSSSGLILSFALYSSVKKYTMNFNQL